jgi:hypothetical protein
MARRIRLWPAALLALAGCAAFPEVSQAERGLVAAPAPALLPTAELAARTAAVPVAAPAGAAVAARAAALRARAAALRAAPAG